jgi:hypothetical protein
MVTPASSIQIPIKDAYDLVYDLAEMSDVFMESLDDLLCCVDVAEEFGLDSISFDELLWLHQED